MTCAMCDRPTSGKSKYCAAHRQEAHERFRTMVADQAATKAEREGQFSALWKRAYSAGLDAALGHQPTPMVVQQHENPWDDNSPVVRQYAPVMDGVCGFAWLVIRPANASFANWVKRTHGGFNSYYGGWEWPIHEHNQSYERKLAHARAMAEVLQAGLTEMGMTKVKVYANGRLD